MKGIIASKLYYRYVMYKNRQFNCILAMLITIMGILCFKLIFVVDKLNRNKNQGVVSVITAMDRNPEPTQKYGYSDILDVLRKNTAFEVKSINMLENQKCNIQVDYHGDIKLLYPSLYSLNESKFFLGINSICINKDLKATSISLDFKKNK